VPPDRHQAIGQQARRTGRERCSSTTGRLFARVRTIGGVALAIFDLDNLPRAATRTARGEHHGVRKPADPARDRPNPEVEPSAPTIAASSPGWPAQ
jgi:hypothetical protein